MTIKRHTGRLATFVFEGGGASSPLGLAMTTLRDAMTLDLLDRLRSADLGGPIVLATDRPGLADAARGAGHVVEPTGPAFQFGAALQGLVSRWDDPPCQAVLCLGGAAAPLATVSDWQTALAPLLGPDPEPQVLANNPQSSDVVAFAPPDAVHNIGHVTSDNALAWALREAGLPRLLMPPEPRFTFDLDTPTDAMVLHVASEALAAIPGASGGIPVAGAPLALGPRTRVALAAFVARPEVAPVAGACYRLLTLLQQPMSEIGLIGRVGTPAIDHVNKRLPVRLRVFSEERGMKGLGREERGEVRSLLGHLLDDVGPGRFLQHLTGICDATLIDLRVLLAHWQLQLAEEDRFRLDLFLPPQGPGPDPRLTAFLAAARPRLDAGYPLLLGGHSLVAGGLQLLAEAAEAEAIAKAASLSPGR